MPETKPFDELDAVEWLKNLLSGRRTRPLLDVGDDAAVVRAPSGVGLVLTTDCLVAGIHYRSDEVPPRAAGRKAVMRAASDIAAMAASPRWVLAALCIPPRTGRGEIMAFCRGMQSACRRLGTEWVGGDLSRTSGPMSAVVTVIGTVAAGRFVKRSGAKAGDAVCVTGALGGSLLGRHLRFIPRVREALELRRRFSPHAMIDISDGLSTDASHLAESGGVQLVLDAPRIPVSRAAVRLSRSDGRSPLRHALNDGEDYELLFTLAPRDAERLSARGLAGTPVTVIGSVRKGRGVRLRGGDGRETALRPGGWEHTFGD